MGETSLPGSNGVAPVNTGKKGPGRRSRFWRFFLYFLALLLVLAAGAAIYLYPGFLPAHWSDDTVLVIGNKKIGEGWAVAEEREIYLHVDPLRSYIDPNFYWDEEEETAVITTEERVIHMQSEELTAEMNMEPLELEFPLKEKEKGLYLPMLFLSDFYGVQVRYLEDTDTVVVDFLEKGDRGYEAEVTSPRAHLREAPYLREATLEVMEKGDLLRVEQPEAGSEWMVVRSKSGKVGYMHGWHFEVTGPYQVEGEEEKGDELEPYPDDEEISVSPPEHPVTLVWEFAYMDVDPDTIGGLGPVDVVSPTWFRLKDSEGRMRNIAEPGYVDWAHERAYQVWGLVASDFRNPQVTGELLSSTSRRKNFIKKVMAYARLYNLDGINIDFENFHSRYRDDFTQLIRELAPLCRKEGLVLSVDVTPISGSIYWSMGYDREALAEAADYIALMAYDEHYASSPVPGSVGSLPWVEESLEEVLEEVPPEKLLLGVPFYTRLWEIEYGDEEGEEIEDISSRAFGMETIEAMLERRGVEPEWDDEAGQYKAVYEEDGKTYKVWLEEEKSIRQRIELVNEYGLAGVAAWRRGFEREEIWEVIDQELDGYPGE